MDTDARRPILRHLGGWICAIGFLYFSRNAWLAFQPPSGMWLNEYHFFGFTFPFVAMFVAMLPGYDLGRAYLWIHVALPSAKFWATSYALRSVLVVVAIFVVLLAAGEHFGDLVAPIIFGSFAALLVASMFSPLRVLVGGSSTEFTATQSHDNAAPPNSR